jgi:FkbM family methyltransferase
MKIFFILLLLGILWAISIVWLHNKIRGTYLRLFHLEDRLREQEKQNISLSRIACIAEARGRLQHCPSELSTHSQHGEEFYLWEAANFNPSGIFVEVGAYNGKDLSNSYFFEKIGWRCILIEAHPELVEQCKNNRTNPSTVTVHAAVSDSDNGEIEFSMVRGPSGVDTLSFVETPDYHFKRIISEGGIIEKTVVPIRTLSSILDEIGIIQIDCLTIDIEGGELKALKGANLNKIKPRVIMIEDNSGGINTEANDFLLSLSYQKKYAIGCNTIYSIT